MIQELYKYVDTDFALCTQWDSWILNADAWTEDFLKYDYIGAPWWFSDEKNVGNGGFSLRSKKFLQSSSRLPIKNFHPEDLVLCRTYRSLLCGTGISFADEKTAAKFSLEGNAKYGQKWTNQFGFHDLEMTDISAWKAPVKEPTVHTIYRICDRNPKTQTGIDKLLCLQNYLKRVTDKNVTIIADNCSTKLKAALSKMNYPVHETSLGNSLSFSYALDLVNNLPDEDIVYMVEDDYLHSDTFSLPRLIEGLEIAEWATLYDHPDKYMKDSPNPYVNHNSEPTRVYITSSNHWKETNSTTMTFAAKVGTIKKYASIMKKYLDTPIPRDFEMWTELRQKTNLISSIPGYATHCHSPWITPFFGGVN